MKELKIISLIGRPNVGKSTIFNRLMGDAHRALTYNKPGVTRDRHYGIVALDSTTSKASNESNALKESRAFKEELNEQFDRFATLDDSDPLAEENKKEFILVDTGGFYPEKRPMDAPDKKGGISKKEEEDLRNEVFFDIMADHARMAIEESDLVLFVVDIREGVLPFDLKIVQYLRAAKKDFWVLVNKADSHAQEGLEVEFFELGVDEEQILPISSAHGRGFGELKERIEIFLDAKEWEERKEKEQDEKEALSSGKTLPPGLRPRETVVGNLAIIGAPNAGKSTLLNRMLGQERSLVSPLAGTTVDPVEAYFDLFFGHNFFEEQKKDVGPGPSVDAESLTEELANEFESEINEEGGEEFEAEFDNDFPREFSEDDQINFQDENSEDFHFQSELESDLELNSELEPELSADFHEEVEDDMIEDSQGEALEGNSKGGQSSPWYSLKIVDTAGIRRKSHVTGHVESQSVFRSLRCITESDIILYVVDATQGITHQDRRLCDIALEKGKSLIICLNKMDLVAKFHKDPKLKKQWMEELKRKLPWLQYCQMIPISAKRGKGIHDLKEAIKKTVIIRKKKISTGRINRCLNDLLEHYPLSLRTQRGKPFKIKYASMVRSDPPTFLMFCNASKDIPQSYRKYLSNGLRNTFGLVNTPVHLIFRKGGEQKAMSAGA